MDNQTEVKITFKNYVNGEKKLERYRETLSKVNSILSGMDKGMINDLSKSAESIKNIDKETKNIGKNVNNAFKYGAIREFTRHAKNLTQEFSALTKSSFDYLENLNLYQVAFDGNTKSADKFINTMAEMYGLDESWLVRNVGIFKQLSNAMNVSIETGNKLSQLLTQMSLDISSLYNVDVERASSVLQSSLAGQTKPIRGLTGGDITQATLQTTLDNLGINRAITDLSFAEKRLLIVISLTDQLSESIGDMGRTIESPSNQMRILNEQWERFNRAIGNVFLPTLEEMLPYLNAILMVLTEIINMVATLFGYNEEDYNFLGDTSDSAFELEEGLSGAVASAEKLKRGLRGFDKLNVITTPSSSGASAGAGSGIDPDIMNAFNKAFDEYQSKLDNVEMKATRIRDALMEWLGFTKVTNLETGEISWQYNGLWETVKNLTKSFGEMPTILKVLIGLGIIKSAKNLVNILGKSGLIKVLGDAKKSFKSFNENVKIGTMLTGNLAGGFSMAISEWQRMLTPMQKLTVGIGGLTIGFSSLKSSIEGVYEEGLSFGSFAESFVGYAGNMVGSIALFGPVLGSIIGLSTSLVETLYLLFEGVQINVDIGNKYVETLQKLKDEKIASAKYTLIEYENVNKLVGELGKLVDEQGKVRVEDEKRAKVIFNQINKAYGTEYELIDGVIYQNGRLVKSYDEVKKQVDDMYAKKVREIKLKAYEDVYIEALKQQKDLNDEISKKQEILELNQKRLNEAKETGRKIDGFTAEELEGSVNRLKDQISSLEDARSGAQQEILNYEKLLESSLSDNQETFEKVLKQYETGSLNVAEKTSSNMSSIFGKVATKFAKSLTGIKVNKPITIDIDGNTNPIKGKLANLFSGATSGFFEKIGIQVPKFYANGGLPPVGQLFVANERGPELVGHIGGQSFVANQNQMMDLLDKKIGNNNSGTKVINIYLDEYHKLGTYTLEQLEDMAKSNGEPITIG